MDTAEPQFELPRLPTSPDDVDAIASEPFVGDADEPPKSEAVDNNDGSDKKSTKPRTRNRSKPKPAAAPKATATTSTTATDSSQPDAQSRKPRSRPSRKTVKTEPVVKTDPHEADADHTDPTTFMPPPSQNPEMLGSQPSGIVEGIIDMHHMPDGFMQPSHPPVAGNVDQQFMVAANGLLVPVMSQWQHMPIHIPPQEPPWSPGPEARRPVERQIVSPKTSRARLNYRCGKCGHLKKGHTCKSSTTTAKEPVSPSSRLSKNSNKNGDKWQVRLKSRLESSEPDATPSTSILKPAPDVPHQIAGRTAGSGTLLAVTSTSAADTVCYKPETTSVHTELRSQQLMPMWLENLATPVYVSSTGQVISQIDGKLMHPGGMLVSRAPMTQLRPTHGLGMMPQQVPNVGPGELIPSQDVTAGPY